ncbi:alpha/beta hydrolase [Undibacterium sp. SXout7W]|uniref:alpha/beta hydrolase n=1 Tax=Undibacterium sp. SXout7W TaxID=3413049 RepID=UPI003BEFFC4C
MMTISLWMSMSQADAATSPCRLPDFPQEVQCGKVTRPLNPAQADGRQIDIHYAILPSQDKNKLPDPVFLFAGGPGQSAINVAAWGQAAMARLNRRRDLVFVDQRGTGRSAPLHCAELEDAADTLTQEQMGALSDTCLLRLQQLPYGDLRFFSTHIAVQDIEAVRRQQGYDKINLLGVSYGTRASLEYARQFPASVRRMVLDGVVPPEMYLPAADAQRALDNLFSDCIQQAQCNAAYPQLATHWQHLLATLKHSPQPVSIAHPRLGSRWQLDMTHELLLGLVHKTLYAPLSVSGLPYAIMQADAGNYAPLLTLSGATSRAGPGGIAYGMHFSVWCSEAYARSGMPAPADDFEKLSAAMYERSCRGWPRAEIPMAFFTIPRSRSPALLLSGGIDPVTPTRHAVAVGKALGSNARLISIEQAGHGLLMQGCVRDVVYRFLNAKTDQDALQLDTSCVRQIPRPFAWQPPRTSVTKEVLP